MSIIHPPLPTAPTHVFPFVISPCLSFGGVHFLSLTQISSWMKSTLLTSKERHHNKYQNSMFAFAHECGGPASTHSMEM